MDPDAALAAAREITEAILNPDIELKSGIEAAEQCAEAWRALDEWLSKGGFVPQAWDDGSGR